MPQKTTGIHHVAMSSNHFDETLKLYQDGLGLKVVHTWGKEKRVAMLDTGDGSCIELFEETDTSIPAAGRWKHLALNSQNIEASYRRAIEAGAKPKMKPSFARILEATPTPVYMWFAFLTGFDGEEIEFIQEELSCPVEG
jgi:glyoxylase I family protein